MKRIAVVAIAVALAGCRPAGLEPTMGMGVTGAVPNSWESNPRFSVSRIGIFADDVAYDGRRVAIVVIDNKTGQEFVGVSGVGIAELRAHSAGKSQVQDER